MFRALCAKYPADRDLPARAFALARLRDVLNGTIYDVLEYPFSTEYNYCKEYIPVYDRRPSVRYNVALVVVTDSVAMLFGDCRFPQLHCTDEPARLQLAALVAQTGLVNVMTDAATRGSVGSVAVRFRVLRGRVFYDVFDTEFLTPEWDPLAPDTLQSVTERYKVRGSDLAAQGYAIAPKDMRSFFWFMRRWTADAEEWYEPWLVNQTKKNSSEPFVPVLDDARTVAHRLGFVPMVWIKNLPGGVDPDGACTFAAAINPAIEIDYQLSQAGRGLRYSSDPLLVVKEPAGSDEEFVRNGANALTIDKDGDAKLLEIGGTAAQAVIEYTGHIRDLALESVHGNRSTPDKMGMAQSGHALELLHEPLISLAGLLRNSYGDALLALVNMAIQASRIDDLQVQIDGADVTWPDDIKVTLRWGHWFTPTHHDNLEEAQALQHHAQVGHISRKTAVGLVCDMYSIPDAPAELKEVLADIAEADARAAALAAKTAAQDTLPE